MIHDLEFGRLENEFRKVNPLQSDIVFCFCENSVLLSRNDDNSIKLPCFGDVNDLYGISGCDVQYAFRFHDANCYVCISDVEFSENSLYKFEPVRTFRELKYKDICFAVMTAWHLYTWYISNRYCGKCGMHNVHDEVERMLKCPKCGNMCYPKISPAVIVAITNGDKILLSKYAGRNYNRFALIAGYTEIGETLEQTVQREVQEEVNLKVKNIRYYKSQPWGVDGNILMGFYCDLDGDSTINIDTDELSYANWYSRGNIPCEDDGISLTREMIRVFDENGGF